MGGEVETAVGEIVLRAVKFLGSFTFLELETAVGAVVGALKWEQRMWWGRDSSRCCSEGCKIETEVGSEVGTAVSAVVRAQRLKQRMCGVGTAVGV